MKIWRLANKMKKKAKERPSINQRVLREKYLRYVLIIKRLMNEPNPKPEMINEMVELLMSGF